MPDLQQMYELWIESLADGTRISTLESALAEFLTSLEKSDALINIIKTYVHPALEIGGHVDNQIKSDTGENLQKYIKDLIDSRLGEVNLKTLLDLAEGKGSTITKNYDLTQPLSPASVAIYGKGPYNPAEFTIEIDPTKLDVTAKAKLTGSFTWTDKFVNDNKITTAITVKVNNSSTDITASALTENTLSNFSVDVPANLLVNGLNTVKFEVAEPPGGRAYIFGNKTGSVKITGAVSSVTHRLSEKRSILAARMIFINKESTGYCGISELELYNADAKLTGLTATATSSQTNTDPGMVVDGSHLSTWYPLVSTPITVSAPQALMVALPAVNDVTAIRWRLATEEASRQPLDYFIQFTTDSSAAVTDEIASSKWFTVTLLNGTGGGQEQAINSLTEVIQPVSGYTEDWIVSNLQLEMKYSSVPFVMDTGALGSIWTKVTWGFSVEPENTSMKLKIRIGNEPNAGPIQSISPGEKPYGSGRYLTVIPEYTLNEAGEYCIPSYISASWVPDFSGDLKRDVYSIQVNLIRTNWELKRYKALLNSNSVTSLNNVYMDIFKDTSGINSIKSSNWTRQSLPNAWGISPLNPEQTTLVQTVPVDVPEDTSELLIIADIDNGSGTSKIEVSKDGGSSWKEAYQDYLVPTSDLFGNQLTLRFTLTENAILRAWAVYY